MKALQKLVAVIALSLPLATLAQEAAKPAEPPKPTVTPYGFVLLNAFFNANTFNCNDYPCGAARVQNGGTFLMSARQSRFGVKLAMNDDNWTGAALTGVIEFDFKGGHVPTTAPAGGGALTGPNSNSWNAGLMRLRLASATATWKTGFGNVAILAGQDYGLVNPLFATSVAYAADPIFWQAGNLWRRTPQIRASWSNQFDAVGVLVQAAMLSTADTVGTSPVTGAGVTSRMPDLEARAALSLKLDGGINGTVGGGYHTNTKRFNRGAATEQDVTASVFGVDLDVNVPFLNLRGEYYSGEGTDDMYNAIGPGNAGAAGSVYAPKTSGYWAQAVIKIIPEIWIPVGMGHAEAKAADVAANARFENDQIHGGVIFNAGKYWQFSVEACQTTTKYNDAAQTKQDALQTSLNSKLSF
jgi:hypothetical protein